MTYYTAKPLNAQIRYDQRSELERERLQRPPVRQIRPPEAATHGEAGDPIAVGAQMTSPARNYSRAVGEVAERLREVRDLLLDAEDAMNTKRPKDGWRHLDDARRQLEGAMVTAKWSQSLFPEEEK